MAVTKIVVAMCLEALTEEPEPIGVILQKTSLCEGSVRKSLKVLADGGLVEKVPIFRRNRVNGRPAFVGWRKVSSSEPMIGAELEPCVV